MVGAIYVGEIFCDILMRTNFPLCILYIMQWARKENIMESKVSKKKSAKAPKSAGKSDSNFWLTAFVHAPTSTMNRSRTPSAH